MAAIWFECKVRYDKMQENGSVRKVNEPYLLDALSFTEAEARIIEELTPYISGEFSVGAVKKTKIAETVLDPEADGRFFLVTVSFITLDEQSGAEKKSPSLILVQANDLEDAMIRFGKHMQGTMADWEYKAVAETQYIDVFPVNKD